MIAAIFAAAMSASGGELNALATATIIDFYRRHFVHERDRRALPPGLEIRDRLLGAFRLRRRDLRREPGFAHRGRQPLRIVFLRIAARRFHPRHPHHARATAAGAFWGLIAGMAVVLTVAFPPLVDLLSRAQRHRRGRRRRGRNGDQQRETARRGAGRAGIGLLRGHASKDLVHRQDLDRPQIQHADARLDCLLGSPTTTTAKRAGVM